MEPKTAPRNAQTGKFLLDRSQEWLRAGAQHEPDLRVDGLQESSLLARVFGRLLKRR